MNLPPLTQNYIYYLQYTVFCAVFQQKYMRDGIQKPPEINPGGQKSYLIK